MVYSRARNQEKGMEITDEQKQEIQDYYESNEFSRELPGQKDFVSVRQADGKRLKLTKRLLLINLSELYGEYKVHLKVNSVYCFRYVRYFANFVRIFQENQIKPVSFSKFAELRPKNVILVGSKGMFISSKRTFDAVSYKN